MPYVQLEPEFSSPMEIRMGSPFRCADLTLKGSWVPDLPNYDWQDLSAESHNGRFLALVAWDIAENGPGFRIVVIDKKLKTFSESKRINGCCKSLAVNDSLVEFETFNIALLSALSPCKENLE